MTKIQILFLSLICTIGYTQPFIVSDGISISNSADLTIVNGDWQSDGALLLSGSIKTSGLFSHAGTINPLSKGGLILNYTGINTLTLGSGVANIGFLSIAGGGTAELLRDIVLKDSLVLNGGFIKMVNTSDTLQMGPDALIKNADANSYVKGIMARQGTGDRLFPIGDDSHYLPIQFYNVQGVAPKLTITLEATPAFTAGSAVSSLIEFPYSWRSYTDNPLDTASNVEVEFPNTLASDPDIIVVRNTSGQSQFEGMGRKTLNETGGTVKVRSYSNGVKGLFSVAMGFPGDVASDSVALAGLYNSTLGPAWTVSSNWLAGPLSSWFGVMQTGGRITSLTVSNNNMIGVVPDLSALGALETLNISGNSITGLPDLTALTRLTSLNVSSNKLNFGSLESNASIIGINYSNQAMLGDSTGVFVPVGTNPVVSTDGGGAADQYQWKYNGVDISGANLQMYTITAIDRSNRGNYTCAITNAIVPGLTLTSAVQTFLPIATLGGKLLVNAGTAASSGKMTLFRVTTAAFDTVAIKPINTDGSFSFDQILLDDYQLMGYADTLVHVDALPTYYVDTPLWEEADTLFVNSNLTALDITSQFKPAPPAGGEGEVSGTLSEPSGGTGGRTRANKAIKDAGVMLRRNDGSALTLIDYKFTNDNGEFVFNSLPPGDYKLNIQYPGYPMDQNSFVDIALGSGPFDKFASVDAEVKDGMISVKKRVITGFIETETYYTIYPNPSTDRITIKSKVGNSRDLNIQIIEATGKALKVPTRYEMGEDVWLLDVRDLPFGSYLVNVENKGGVVVIRVAITK